MNKKIKWLISSFFFFLILIMPKNVEAFQCKYMVYPINGQPDSGEPVELIFDIQKDGDETVYTPPFTGKKIYDAYPTWSWEFSSGFKEHYLSEAIKNDTARCPNIVVNTSVSGAASIMPSSYSETAKSYYTFEGEMIINGDDNIEIAQIENTCTITAQVVDALNDNAVTDDTIQVTFSIYNNYLKTWKINDSNEVFLKGNDSTEYQIAFTDDSGATIRYFVSLDVLNNMYKADSLDMTCPSKLYACKEEMASVGLHNYTLRSGPSCSTQTHIGNANLDGLNQAIECRGLFSNRDEGSVYDLLQTLLNYMKILGPILVVILSAVDFIKAVASSDEEAMKKAQHRLIIRLTAAIALFLVPTLVQLILDVLVGASDPNCLLQ